MLITGYLSKHRLHIIVGDKQFGTWEDSEAYDRSLRELRLIKTVEVL